MPPTESSNGILRNGVMDRRGGIGTERGDGVVKRSNDRNRRGQLIEGTSGSDRSVRTETIPPPRFYSGVDTVYD